MTLFSLKQTCDEDKQRIEMTCARVCKIALAQFSIFAKRYDDDELEAKEVEDEQCD